MKDAFEVYNCYVALNLHFAADKSYDYQLYSGKTSLTLDSYNKRKDRQFFYRIHQKWKKESESFLVSNFSYHDKPPYVADLVTKDAAEIHLARTGRLDSLVYTFQKQLGPHLHDIEELVRVDDGKHPLLLKEWMRKKVDMEPLLMLNCLLDFLPEWHEKITDQIIWPTKYNRLVKYRPFVMISDETIARIRPLVN